jgi:hypothetical protein
MAPSKISRHEIKDMIARGGLATVYLAFDPGSKRDVAEATAYLTHVPHGD